MLTPINQKTTRAALNISGLKKSAPRTTSFGAAPAEFETEGGPRLAIKGAAARIYAPHPSIPPVVPPLPGFPTPEFKTPSLPFARSVEEVSRGPNHAHTSSPAAATDHDVANMFRPKSCRPQQQGEIGGVQTRRPLPPSSSEQSFFSIAKFPFDSSSSAGDLDDSGYFSEHTPDDTEADRFGSAKRNDGANSDTRFAKRGRAASPGNDGDEDIGVMAQQQSNRPPRDLPKRPCVRSPSRSRGGPLSTTAPMLESRAPDAREGASARAFVLPPHIPHPMAAMGELPGLEFSEADLARYAELYERGSERWSKAPMEEWVAGADDILAKFGDMMDMVSRSLLAVRTWTFVRLPDTFTYRSRTI